MHFFWYFYIANTLCLLCGGTALLVLQNKSYQHFKPFYQETSYSSQKPLALVLLSPLAEAA